MTTGQNQLDSHMAAGGLKLMMQDIAVPTSSTVSNWQSLRIHALSSQQTPVARVSLRSRAMGSASMAL